MTNNKLTPENVTRFAQYGADMMEWPDGGYVKYEDYSALAAELQERRKAASEPVGYFGRFDPDDDDLIDQCSKNVKGAFPLYRHAQPAPVVPDEMPEHTGPREFGRPQAYVDGWNACRAAMLQAEPVTTANKLGNSPVIPDGYVMVPRDATLDMLKAGAKQEMKGEAFQYVWQAMLAAAPQEVKP